MTGRVLTDEDIDELMRRLDKTWERHMETIGYDVSSPKARAEIHADHAWVRDWRTGSTKARMVAVLMLWTTILGGAGTAFWMGISAAVRAMAAAKGGS